MNYKLNKLDKNQASKLLRTLMNGSGAIEFSRHAQEELEKDGLTTQDALNILKSPDARINNDGELENGSYRYRVETKFILVVIMFWSSGKGLIVITAWDKRK